MNGRYPFMLCSASRIAGADFLSSAIASPPAAALFSQSALARDGNRANCRFAPAPPSQSEPRIEAEGGPVTKKTRSQAAKDKADENLDEALMETFPASDPPAMTEPSPAARPARKSPKRPSPKK